MQREKSHRYFDLLAPEGKLTTSDVGIHDSVTKHLHSNRKLVATCPVDAFQAYTFTLDR